jgi:hypothetical protein
MKRVKNKHSRFVKTVEQLVSIIQVRMNYFYPDLYDYFLLVAQGFSQQWTTVDSTEWESVQVFLL